MLHINQGFHYLILDGWIYINELQNNIKKKKSWHEWINCRTFLKWIERKKKEKEKVGAEWKWGVLGHAKLDLEVKILEIGVF